MMSHHPPLITSSRRLDTRTLYMYLHMSSVYSDSSAPRAPGMVVYPLLTCN